MVSSEEAQMTRFVIVVDMQRDFVTADGALPVPGAEALIVPAREWLAALDPAETAGVLFTFDTHDPAVYAGSPESAQFPPHCERGSPGWALVADWQAIDPAIPVYRLEKGVFDMWEEDGLTLRDARSDGAPIARDAFFGALEVDSVTVIGVAADYCVRWAIEGLIARGFAVEVPEALTRGIAREIDAVVAEMAAVELVR
jgi:nicotinamidase/pyrazinamidase